MLFRRRKEEELCVHLKIELVHFSVRPIWTTATGALGPTELPRPDVAIHKTSLFCSSENNFILLYSRGFGRSEHPALTMHLSGTR